MSTTIQQIGRDQANLAARLGAAEARIEKIAASTAADAMSQFAFRKLLTDAEADAWIELVEQARAAVAAGTADATQKAQLRAWRDFHLPPGIELDAAETQGGIFALYAWGVFGLVWDGADPITPDEQAALDRMNRVAAGLPPE